MNLFQRLLPSFSIRTTTLLFFGCLLSCGWMAEAIHNYYLSSLTAKDELEFFAEKVSFLLQKQQFRLSGHIQFIISKNIWTYEFWLITVF